MTTPEFKNWFTAGNIWQIMVTIVTVSLAVGTMTMTISSAVSALEDHETRIRRLEETMSRELSAISWRLQNIEAILNKK